MSQKHDRQFVSMVSVVIGGLIGLAVGIFALASYVGRHGGGARLDDPEYVREVRERTAPVGTLAVAGRDNSALAIVGTAAAAAAPAAAPPVSTAVLSGPEVYRTTCAVCHATGVGGAPKYGDRAAWAPRLAQGTAVLHQHALAGVQGKAGVMPPKGGRADLADQSVINAVDYIAAAAR
jgi:cytochrome c5